MGKTNHETIEKRMPGQRQYGRLAAVAAASGVLVAVFFVVWFVLSGFVVGLGVDGYDGASNGTGSAEDADGYGSSVGDNKSGAGTDGGGAVNEETAAESGQSDSSSSTINWNAPGTKGAPKTGKRGSKIVQVAAQQIGNIGGRKFWSWYGYPGRVEWCACFVSWCADLCGYIGAGVVPKFAAVVDGVAWFADRQQWRSRGYAPQPGDIIFFDWEQDGTCDHVGIVEKCDGERVYTIEGNSMNMCRRKSYPVGSPVIYGYGAPKI